MCALATTFGDPWSFSLSCELPASECHSGLEKHLLRRGWRAGTSARPTSLLKLESPKRKRCGSWTARECCVQWGCLQQLRRLKALCPIGGWAKSYVISLFLFLCVSPWKYIVGDCHIYIYTAASGCQATLGCGERRASGGDAAKYRRPRRTADMPTQERPQSGFGRHTQTVQVFFSAALLPLKSHLSDIAGFR